MITFFTRAVLILVLMSPGLQSAFAQNENRTRAGGGAGFFSPGISVINIDDLNNRLEAAGYPTLSRTVLSFGGGGYGIVAGVLMIGGEGYGLIGIENASQDRSVSLGGGYGLLNIGYLRRLTSHMRIYPMLGIGGGGLSLNIGSTDEANSFDDALREPGRQSTITRGNLLISLSGGLEYRFGDAEGGFLIGLRAGYMLVPFQSSWSLGGDTLSDSPAASLAGPFVRLTIGGGS